MQAFRNRSYVAGLSIVAFLSASAGAQVLSFTDQAAPAGVSHSYMPASQEGMDFMAAGGAAGDFNRDGWQDLFILGGWNGVDRLFINDGDGTFTDRASAWGVARTHRGFGVAVGDYDGNGWLDIFVQSWGASSPATGKHLLYHNNGDGTFTERAAAAGVAFTSTTDPDGFGACFGDYDLDGDLDLAAAGWMGTGTGNRLFRNNGDGTFTDVTGTAFNGFDLNATNAVRGFCPRFADMDGDRYPELLWVSDFFTTKYFINNGDGTFTEATAAAGVGLDSNGMGNSIGDFDNDGDFDWHVTSRINDTGTDGSGNMLYVNEGNHVYTEVSGAAGTNYGYWGWGGAFADLDNDGWLDIVATNGFMGPWHAVDPTVLFISEGNGTFTESAAACGLDHTYQGRVVIPFDMDNNGTIDVAIASNAQPLVLFRNELSGPGCNYLRVFLENGGHAGVAPDGMGAVVSVTAGGMTQVRQISNGDIYLSQSELSAHFGLGAAETVDELRIEWPNGMATVRANVPANETLTVRLCAPDFTGEGQLGVGDFSAFRAAYLADEQRADFNGDGSLSVADFSAFRAAYLAGCP